MELILYAFTGALCLGIRMGCRSGRWLVQRYQQADRKRYAETLALIQRWNWGAFHYDIVKTGMFPADLPPVDSEKGLCDLLQDEFGMR